MHQDYKGRTDSADFDREALKVFQLQYDGNPLYRQFADALKRTPYNVRDIEHTPYLPVSFFKNFQIMTGQWEPSEVFHSSGTTGMEVSRHLVPDTVTYSQHALRGFEHFYGPVRELAVLGLLPSYLERGSSSLVAMVKAMVEESGYRQSGFYLNDFAALHATLKELEEKAVPTLLLGVTFALLDFAELFPMQLNNTIVMETGGMKGRKREMTRAEVHEVLKRKLGKHTIHAEYGMTELFSQAYAAKDGHFTPIPAMKVLVRDHEDPLTVSRSGNGALNIIDLANVHSCAFLATEDTGKVFDDGSFEVWGRMDHSALRGCSLMAV